MPTNVVTVPNDELTTERKASLAQAANDKALEVTANTLNKDRGDLVVRDINVSTDLNQTNNEYVLNISSANTFSQAFNITVDNGKTITIYAVDLLDANPDVRAIQFSDGASTRNEIQVEDALSSDQPTVFLESPIVYEEQDTFDLALYAATSGDKKVVLRGFVAEDRGENVDPGSGT